MKYLLDTHAWIWCHMNPAKLSKHARNVISESAKYEELLLSAISPWEFSKLLKKGKLVISLDPEAWISAALEMPKLRLVPLSPAIAYRSTTLPDPFHEDPADQIIVATAREENATVVTMDDRIRSYPHVSSTW